MDREGWEELGWDNSWIFWEVSSLATEILFMVVDDSSLHLARYVTLLHKFNVKINVLKLFHYWLHLFLLFENINMVHMGKWWFASVGGSFSSAFYLLGLSLAILFHASLYVCSRLQRRLKFPYRRVHLYGGNSSHS